MSFLRWGGIFTQERFYLNSNRVAFSIPVIKYISVIQDFRKWGNRKNIAGKIKNNVENLKKLLFTMIENIPAERSVCECAYTKKNSQL